MHTHSHNEIVLGQYRSQADAYVASAVHAQGADLDLLAELIGERPAASVLDVGCGGGHVSFRLAPLVGRVMACDLTEQMLTAVAEEALGRGLGNISTTQTAAEDLPFPSASFDIVATRYSAHHWRDLAAGVGQMHRVLKPGGLAVFMDVVTPADPLLDTWLQSLELLRDPSHVRNASLDEWRKLLAEAGFTLGQEAPSRIRLDFAAWVGRMKTPDVHVAAIRSLQQRASREVTGHFEIADDGSFSLDTALIAATKA